jgi:hypothetical protein
MSEKYALIIGNSEYDDARLAQLTAPGKDAEALAHVLGDKELCAFDDVKVVVNQTDWIVRQTIDEFFDEKGTQDLLLLYFSGHGVRDEQGMLYLAVKNTIRSRLRSTAIQSDFIHQAMEQSRSRRQVLILDCCNSGAFAQGAKAAAGGSIGIANAFGGGYGRIILTASDSLQYAWQGDAIIGEMKNSLFTHYLVEGLKGEAEVDANGCITVDALYDYAYEQVRLATPNQTPSKFSSKQEGEIVLRKIQQLEQVKAAPLPDALVESLENPFSAIRLGAVQELARLLKSRNLGLAKSAREALEHLEQEDDSRTVQSAARQALEPIRQAELIAVQKAEEERLAAEQAERERIAKEEAEQIAKQEAEEERLAVEQRDAGRWAREKAEAERQTSAEVQRAEPEGLATDAKVYEATLGTEADAGKQAAMTPSVARRTSSRTGAVVLYGGVFLILAILGAAFFSVGPQIADSMAATETAVAVATSQARTNLVSSFVVPPQPAFGPSPATLTHDPANGLFEWASANLSVRNFMAQALFFNPYPTSKGSWDYGFAFRNVGPNDQYRLYVTSKKQWVLENFTGTKNGTQIAHGFIPNLNTSAGDSNSIRLTCWNEKGVLYVNQTVIADLDLSGRQDSGDVEAGTGFIVGDEIEGYATQLLGFTVWSLR